jgi:hypothetical protein
MGHWRSLRYRWGPPTIAHPLTSRMTCWARLPPVGENTNKPDSFDRSSAWRRWKPGPALAGATLLAGRVAGRRVAGPSPREAGTRGGDASPPCARQETAPVPSGWAPTTKQWAQRNLPWGWQASLRGWPARGPGPTTFVQTPALPERAPTRASAIQRQVRNLDIGRSWGSPQRIPYPSSPRAFSNADRARSSSYLERTRFCRA